MAVSAINDGIIAYSDLDTCIIRIFYATLHQYLAHLKYISYLCNRNRPAAEWGAAVALNK